MLVRLPNENANQLQTTCESLWSLVATGSVGRGRRPASPAFVGCISGLDSAERYWSDPQTVSGTPRPRQILRARRSGISVCRGTAWTAPVAGFNQRE